MINNKRKGKNTMSIIMIILAGLASWIAVSFIFTTLWCIGVVIVDNRKAREHANRNPYRFTINVDDDYI